MKLQTSWINNPDACQYIFDGLVRGLVEYSGLEPIKTVTDRDYKLVFLDNSYGTLLKIEFTPEIDELFVPLLQAIIKQIEEYDEKET